MRRYGPGEQVPANVLERFQPDDRIVANTINGWKAARFVHWKLPSSGNVLLAVVRFDGLSADDTYLYGLDGIAEGPIVERLARLACD